MHTRRDDEPCGLGEQPKLRLLGEDGLAVDVDDVVFVKFYRDIVCAQMRDELGQFVCAPARI